MINPVLLDLNEMERENLRFSLSISFKSSKTGFIICGEKFGMTHKSM